MMQMSCLTREDLVQVRRGLKKDHRRSAPTSVVHTVSANKTRTVRRRTRCNQPGPNQHPRHQQRQHTRHDKFAPHRACVHLGHLLALRRSFSRTQFECAESSANGTLGNGECKKTQFKATEKLGVDESNDLGVTCKNLASRKNTSKTPSWQLTPNVNKWRWLTLEKAI